MNKDIENQMLEKMFQVADNLLKTSPEVNKMLDACVTEEERNVKLAIAVVRVMSKDIAKAVLTNKDLEQ